MDSTAKGIAFLNGGKSQHEIVCLHMVPIKIFQTKMA
jgi:hypothetical protein